MRVPAWQRGFSKRRRRQIRHSDRRYRQGRESEIAGWWIAVDAGFDGAQPSRARAGDAAWRRLRGLGDLARRRPNRAAAEMRKRLEGGG